MNAKKKEISQPNLKKKKNLKKKFFVPPLNYLFSTLNLHLDDVQDSSKQTPNEGNAHENGGCGV